MHPGWPHKRRFDVAPRQAESSTSAVTVAAEGTSSTAVSTPSSSTVVSQTETTSSSTAIPSQSFSTVSSTASSTERVTSTTQIPTTSSSVLPSSTLVSSTTSASRFSTTIVPSSTTIVSSASTIVSSASTVVPSALTLQLTAAPIPTSPPTTFIVTAESSSDTPTTVIGTYTFSPSTTNEPGSSLADGFWQNKGAVAGTFTALGVFVLGIVAAFIILRRRRARRTQSEDEFFENFAVTSGHGDRDSTPAYSRDHTQSPDHSVAELAGQAPMDAYAGNQIYNINYRPNYQPGTPYGLASVNEGAIGYPNHSNPQMTQNYYIPPPASAMHNEQAEPRRSHQLSIDSFYGAP